MSKKNTGLLVALGAIVGAAAAGLSYYLKYKSFNDDLEKDFHEYEDEEDNLTEDSSISSCDTANRTYISLNKASECTNPCECADTCECEESAPDAETCECECSTAEETCEACDTATATVKEETEGAAE